MNMPALKMPSVRAFSSGRNVSLSSEFEIGKDAMMELIRRYTREAGVRNLEREINTLARKAVKGLLKSKTTKKIKITRPAIPILLCRNAAQKRDNARRRRARLS